MQEETYRKSQTKTPEIISKSKNTPTDRQEYADDTVLFPELRHSHTRQTNTNKMEKVKMMTKKHKTKKE